MNKNTNGIYKFENKINHKVYIGQANNLLNRYNKHKNNIKDLKHQELFYKALRKYGWDNFSYEILEEFSEEEYSQDILNELEIYYINKYNSIMPNGYNMTIGGQYSSENIKIPVRQYDLKGNFIKEYNSLTEAAKDNNISTIGNIISCCKGKRNYVNNYQWRYSKDNINCLDDISNKVILYNLKINQYDLEGNFLKQYNSLKEVCEINNFKKSNICMALKHKNKMAFNFQWRYENDNTPLNNLNAEIYQLDKNEIIINKFINASEASKLTKIHRGNIGECLNHKRKSAGGFKWIYVKEYEDNLKEKNVNEKNY